MTMETRFRVWSVDKKEFYYYPDDPSVINLLDKDGHYVSYEIGIRDNIGRALYEDDIIGRRFTVNGTEKVKICQIKYLPSRACFALCDYDGNWYCDISSLNEDEYHKLGNRFTDWKILSNYDILEKKAKRNR